VTFVGERRKWWLTLRRHIISNFATIKTDGRIAEKELQGIKHKKEKQIEKKLDYVSQESPEINRVSAILACHHQVPSGGVRLVSSPRSTMLNSFMNTDSDHL
jgi:hypothetical protein